MNRSQRCGVCRGCQSKPCGHCVYCQDSPQFGGPGVKKQSCIERRCLRVLENRLQRDGPTFKAKAGCQSCDECLSPDCQVCLVCLDKKFFENRYLPGAMCAKKRCNQSRTLELPYLGPPPGVHHQGQQNGMDFHHQQQMQQQHIANQLPPQPTPIAPHPGHVHAVPVMDGVFASVFHNGLTHQFLTCPPASPGASKRTSPSESSFDFRDGSPRKRRPQEAVAAAPTAATLLASAPIVPLNGAVSVAISHHPILQAQYIPPGTMTLNSLNGGATLWTPQRVPLASSPQVAAPTNSPSPQTPQAQYACVSTGVTQSPDPFAYRPLGMVDVNQNPPTSISMCDQQQTTVNNGKDTTNCTTNGDNYEQAELQHAAMQQMQQPMMYAAFGQDQLDDMKHRWDLAAMSSPSVVLGAPEQLIPPSLSGKHQVVLQPL